MKAIIQRVLSASVAVDNEVVSSIGKGLLVLAAVAPYDTPKGVEAIANKILRLKVWDDEGGGRWKRSVLDLDYQVLLVSQFTLLATTKKGNKPDFHGACPPAVAREIYASLLQKTRELYVEEKKLSPGAGSAKVQDGVFGAMMEVSLVNDGPVTFEISSPMKQVETPLGGEGKTQGKKIPKLPLRTGKVKSSRARRELTAVSSTRENEHHIRVPNTGTLLPSRIYYKWIEPRRSP